MRISSSGWSAAAVALCVLAGLSCSAQRAVGALEHAFHVTLTVPRTALAVGQSAQLSVAVSDGSGQPVSNPSVQWHSGNAAVVAVSDAGVATALSPGESVVKASVGADEDSVHLIVTQLQEPTPNAAATLWHDDFERYRVAYATDGTPSLRDSYALRGDQQLVAGYNGGQAVRFPYTAASYDNLIEKMFAAQTDLYVTYRYRTSPGADPTCRDRGVGMKWFLAWRSDGAPRYTMGINNLDTYTAAQGAPNTGLEFSSADNSTPTGGYLQNVRKTPKFGTTNDGQWHTYTVHFVTGSGGYEQIWVDGVLVLNSSGFGDRHDAGGIQQIDFPGNVVTWFSGCDFTIDVDDLTVWHR